MSEIPTAKQVTNEALRKATSELLKQCSDKENALFDKIFPKGVPDEHLADAYALVRRTIIANHKDGGRREDGDVEGR